MRFFFLLFLILGFSACDEFYDEDFEKDLEESSRTNDNGRVAEDISYTAELSSTDAAVGISGNVKIDLRGDQVDVDLNVTDIPENIVQLHYSYIAAGCDSLSIAIPDEGGTTRSYDVSESTSVDALENDLRAAGASSSDGDIDLSGKSFIVKAFSNLSGLPNPNGTNQITILCGELREAGDDTGGNPFPDDSDTTGTFGTTTTTGTTTF